MIDFREHRDLQELTLQQRAKMSRSARKSAKRRARKRKARESRMKTPDQMRAKAAKAARGILIKKFFKNADYANLSATQKEKIEKFLKTKKMAIKKIAKKLMPKVKKSEKERLANLIAKKSQTEDRMMPFTDFNSKEDK